MFNPIGSGFPALAALRTENWGAKFMYHSVRRRFSVDLILDCLDVCNWLLLELLVTFPWVLTLQGATNLQLFWLVVLCVLTAFTNNSIYWPNTYFDFCDRWKFLLDVVLFCTFVISDIKIEKSIFSREIFRLFSNQCIVENLIVFTNKLPEQVASFDFSSRNWHPNLDWIVDIGQFREFFLINYPFDI